MSRSGRRASLAVWIMADAELASVLAPLSRTWTGPQFELVPAYLCLPPPNGSAFSGVAHTSTAAAEAWIHAILPRSIDLKRCHVRCNGSYCTIPRTETADREVGLSAGLDPESVDRKWLGPCRRPLTSTGHRSKDDT
jgi:hypothetical protein